MYIFYVGTFMYAYISEMNDSNDTRMEESALFYYYKVHYP